MTLYSNSKIKEEYKSFLAAELINRTTQTQRPLALVVYIIGDNPSSQKYVAMKQKWAADLGISVVVREYRSDENQTLIEAQLRLDSHNSDITGIIIQLPVRDQYRYLVSLIPQHKDVDCINYKNYPNSKLLQPTVQSIFLVLNDIVLPSSTSIATKLQPSDLYKTKRFVVIGQGNLVGGPVTAFLHTHGYLYKTITIETHNPQDISRRGDIIICGAGSPKLVNSDWISPPALVIDAATSNDNGQLVGDVDTTDRYDESITFVPSPGGIGPLTVYSLFYNLLQLETFHNSPLV